MVYFEELYRDQISHGIAGWTCGGKQGGCRFLENPFGSRGRHQSRCEQRFQDKACFGLGLAL